MPHEPAAKADDVAEAGADVAYAGFEQGPIRPPSESDSLLLRVTRGCPWNRCTFCGLYKEETFSRRPVVDVLRDIDTIRRFVDALSAGESAARAVELPAPADWNGQMALQAARHWLHHGCRSVFLQDSNSLIIKPDDLVAILRHLRAVFPGIARVTSYTRSQTIARISDRDLDRLAEAGLNRLHIGLESGSDAVLSRVRKGADKATHILAGRKVKRSGIELSEYVMPGLGGRDLSREHALESADALNHINPDFIRLRTLAIPDTIELAREVEQGAFQPMGDRETAEELLLFVQSLAGITSQVKSDHILNLFEEVEGRLPDDQARMAGVIARFLAMPPEEQVLYQIGRRTGVFHRLDDRREPARRRHAEQFCQRIGATPENVDAICAALKQRFI